MTSIASAIYSGETQKFDLSNSFDSISYFEVQNNLTAINVTLIGLYANVTIPEDYPNSTFKIVWYGYFHQERKESSSGGGGGGAVFSSNKPKTPPITINKTDNTSTSEETSNPISPQAGGGAGNPEPIDSKSPFKFSWLAFSIAVGIVTILFIVVWNIHKLYSARKLSQIKVKKE